MRRGKVKIARLPGELAQELEHAAEAGGISRSSFGNVLLSIWINEMQNEGTDPHIRMLAIHSSDKRITFALSQHIFSILQRIAMRKGLRVNDVIAYGIERGLESWRAFPNVPSELKDQSRMKTLLEEV